MPVQLPPSAAAWYNDVVQNERTDQYTQEVSDPMEQTIEKTPTLSREEFICHAVLALRDCFEATVYGEADAITVVFPSGENFRLLVRG